MHKHENDTNGIPHCILLGGPSRRQPAAFLGKWLESASRLNELWHEACQDAKFAAKADLVLRVVFEPNFDRLAVELVTRLKPASLFKYEPVIVNIEDIEGHEVVFMILAGLFAKIGSRYDFAIPNSLTVDTVKAACLQLASTEDEQHFLRPEYVVEFLTLQMATDWKAAQMCTDLHLGIR